MYARSNYSFAGIAIQPAKGTAASISTALPLAGGESIERQWDIQYSEFPDGQIYDVWSVKRGEWAQGDLPVFLHPDLLATLSGVFALQSDGQPPYVTALVGIGNRYTKQIVDARVTGVRFSFSRRDLPQVTFTLQGRLVTIGTATPPTVVALTTPPFTRQETLLFGTVVSGGVLTLNDNLFTANHWANLFVQSVEVNIEFNPIDANELIPFGDIFPIDVLTTVVRVTGNMSLYAPNPVIPEIFQLIQGSEFALGVLLRRGTKTAKLTLRRVIAERVPVSASGDKTSLESFSVDFRALAPIISGTVYPPYDFTVVP